MIIDFKEFFNEIEFDEEKHEYKISNLKLTPVSYKIKDFCIPFDTLGNANRVAQKLGKTVDEILDEWENKKVSACDLGTKVHLFGELYNGTQEPTNGFEVAIVKFFKIIPDHIKLVCNELRMYNKSWRIAGTMDLLFYNEKTGKYLILDWKTNIDLFKNFKGQRLLNPFGDLLDCPYSKYVLQLSYYQLLLEQTGVEVETRCLIWLKSDGTFTCHKTPDVTEKLLQTLINKTNDNKRDNTEGEIFI